MILRKPYAFFIKHFKLMHMILAVLICYSIVKTKELLDFFNEYSSIIINVQGQDLITPLLPGFFQFVPFLIIIISIIIMIVLIVKKKNYLFYIILTAGFVYNTIIIQLSKTTLVSMTKSIIESQTVLLVRDLIMIGFIIQLVEVVIVFVRATGFDVKKFDFDADLKKINITEQDREEVEIQVNFDSNKLVRNIRKQIRFIKYLYKENKKLVNILIGFFSIIIVVSIGVAIFKKDTIINQNTYFTGNYFTLNVIDSYLTNSNYKGKVLTDDYYLILRINIKSNTTNKQILDIATTKILIDNYVYTPITQYKDSFSDFGYVYQGEEIGSEYEEKILVYQITKELIKKEMIFSYVDKNNSDEKGNFKSTKIKIDYQTLLGIDSSITKRLNEELDFSDTILKNAKIKISAFDIQKKFKLNYNYCINERCFNSYEYLLPTVNSNYNKILLKISGELKTEKKLNGIYDLYDFILKFGKLSYTIDGNKIIHPIEFKEVNSKKVNQDGIYYLEVIDEVAKADSVSFIFTIRNKNYEYILK